MLNIYPVRAFKDNYIWVIHNEKYAVVVDPGDANPVLSYLYNMNLQPVAILNTHHHNDHVGGNAKLLEQYSIPVYGPENKSVTTITNHLKANDHILFEELSINLNVLEIPGHTLDHIAYYSDTEESILFCGDTLFACGCGRVFEGTAQQMFTSLQQLANLPNDTLVYSAHEYTLSNACFARLVEPENIMLLEREIEIKLLRDKGLPTLPTTIATEKETNPFLRCNYPEIIRNVSNYAGKTLSDPISVFTELRKWKNNF